MKKATILLAMTMAFGCGKQAQQETGAVVDVQPTGGGQSTVQDDVSQQNIVQVAVGSPDHTVLVAALKQAEYVDVLVNAGPFTVFAPVNAAFEALPEGTVESLMKPENKDALRNILEYHVYVGVIHDNMIGAERVINQVNLENVTLRSQDGKITANDANVLAVINTSNGVIYVIDKVLLPPDKK